MRRILLPTLIVAVAVSLAGCTAGTKTGVDSVSPADSQAPQSESLPAPQSGSSDSRFAEGTEGFEGAPVPGAVAEQDRSVVTTGTVTVTAEEPLEAATDAVRIVESAGGRIDARTETAPQKGDRGSATLTVRIPTSSLTATLDKLKALGKTENVALTSVDVTTQVQDLDARISALRASVDRLTALLSTATDTDTLIKLETAISERQGNLESLEAQQRGLADQVSLSTIELWLISEADAPVETPDTFWSGLVAGWAAFTGFLGFLLVAAGVLLPWIVLAAIAAGVTLLIVRRRRRASAAVIAAGATESDATGAD